MRWVAAYALVASVASAGPAAKPAPPPPKPAAAKPPAGPVNLLRAVPATVAVSSTVANNMIVPSHIADGDLGTAWNSKTGELVGAWLAVRVPADAKVASIKLTVGFTKIDKKLGDLFTMNSRIKKLRVTHAGKTVLEQVLDLDNRGLQELPINGDGGDYKLEVLEIQPGTKAAWKEISVSELEVWGTPGPSFKPRALAAPTVRIGSLDPPADLPDAECVRALFPAAKGKRIADGDSVVAVESLALGNTTYVCRVEHTTDDAEIHAVDIAVVRGSKQAKYVAADARVTGRTRKHEDTSQMTEEGEDVKLDTLPLTPTETAITVSIVESRSGPMLADDHTKTTLYRATKAGLVEILSFESTYSGGESSDADRCSVAVGTVRAATFPDLDLTCTKEQGRWHGEDPRGNGLFTEDRVEHLRWNGSSYAAP